MDVLEYNIIDEKGDYQTPIKLTEKVCKLLAGEGMKPRVLIEPTCGMGNFVITAIKQFDTLEKVICVDVNQKERLVIDNEN